MKMSFEDLACKGGMSPLLKAAASLKQKVDLYYGTLAKFGKG